MELKAIEIAVLEHHERFKAKTSKGSPIIYQKVPYMRSQYHKIYTNGLSLASVGDKIRLVGFNPDTHRIFS